MGAQDDPLSQWFAIPAFFVVFRETLEATVLVAVIIQYLQRAGQHDLEQSVWSGAFLGGVTTLIFGVVVLSIYYTTASALEQDAALITEGVMLGLASILITYFFVTHLAPGMKSNEEWKIKWERKMGEMVEDAISGKDPRNFFCLTFTSVFREGLEAVVFITGIGAMYTPYALIVPSICGILVGVVLGFLMFVGSKRLDLSWFFIVSAVILLFIAAGLASHASYEFQKAGVLGRYACYNCGDDDDGGADIGYRLLEEAEADDTAFCDDAADWNAYRRLSDFEEGDHWARKLLTDRMRSCDGRDRQIAWVNQEMWDITGCCDTDNMFFFLMMVLFWYRPAPTHLEGIVYLAYWVFAFSWGYWKVKSIKEYNADLHAEVKKRNHDEEELEGDKIELGEIGNMTHKLDDRDRDNEDADLVPLALLTEAVEAKEDDSYPATLAQPQEQDNESQVVDGAGSTAL
mmetsp:Transcript_14538/g.42936  ORF Transcript_14538/g.42936 Transcript_14538/m.42936 type:complete len:459 (-) Transcript_14538:138-1514(-)